MKLILDPEAKLNHVVLENYKHTTYDVQLMLKFVEDAHSVHESIAGIFFRDQYDKEHLLEFHGQSVQALLLTIQSLALRKGLSIQYDDYPAPLFLWATFFRMPVWFISLVHLILRPDISFRNLFKHVDARKKISESVCK